jgi:hypothetical protein
MNTLIQSQVKGGNTEMPIPPMLYTVKPAAYLLGVRTTTMYVQINARKIRVCKVGVDVRDSHQAIVDFIASDEKGFNFDA